MQHVTDTEWVILLQLAEAYGIKSVWVVTPGDKYVVANGEETFKNKSYIVGKDEIIMGLYDDPNLFVASFFHEIGHAFIDKVFTNRVELERMAWVTGFQIAEKHGYKFPDYVYDWTIKQIATYQEPKIPV
jgi:hypothetical protein